MKNVSRKKVSTAVASAAFLLLAGAGIVAAPASYAGVPGGTSAVDRNSDFNGDGYDDVLIGAPDGTVDGKQGAGYVTVQYGAPNGIATNTTVPKGHTAVISQSTPGVPGDSVAYDSFGQAVATGDVNGDGYDDALIGAPGKDEGGAENAGRVTVLYGSKAGLGAEANTSFASTRPTAGARFGQALAAARFTGATDADEMAVLDNDGAQIFAFHTDILHLMGTLNTTTRPGGHRIQPAYLTTGDYDRNGFADLVVSGYSPDDDYQQGWSALYAGGETQLTYRQDLNGGLGTASGDVNGDGYDDLVVGQRSSADDQAEGDDGGKIAVYYGSARGATGPADWWSQNSPGVPGAAEHGDAWGNDLSVGDVDGDGCADIAVGAPGEDIGTVRDAGAVWLLRGSRAGVTATGAQSFDQNTAGIPGTAETDDAWGSQVRLADTDADGRSELVASAPGENSGDGYVWLLPAGPDGLLAQGSSLYGAADLGGAPKGARFGAAIDE
ncbi:esterase [Streptomyces sp. NPDC091219]|uniref:esterase n=1 Tax=Streptomyces sp. NPDC091219 TaxID=3155193 RepID=UPI0034506A00